MVVGVHTPEFAFEKDPDDVSRAVREARIDHPVATDNDYAVWSAFDNHYWPALYFAADARGAEAPADWATLRSPEDYTGQRLHQLVRQPGPIIDRTFEITFPDPEVQAYAFTFG